MTSEIPLVESQGSPSVLARAQGAATVYAWCAFVAIPLGVGIMATRHPVRETLWFVGLAMGLGASLSFLRATGRWGRRSSLSLASAFMLIGIVTAWVRSSTLLPFALLGAAAIFLVGNGRGWSLAAVSTASLHQALAVSPAGPKAWLNRTLRLGIMVLTVLTLAQIARFSLYMADGSLKLGWPVPLASPQGQHECLIAYVHAAALNERGVTDPYNPAWYDSKARPRGNSNAEAKPILEGADHLLKDVWLYPPQALVLPQLGIAITKSYPMLRTGWFALQSVLIVGVLLLIARGLGPSSPALVLLPLLWCARPFLTNMQFGQPHFLVLCASALAMMLFRQGRHVGGGCLLAWAISLKLFPAFLGLYLLFGRQYRAIAATAVWSVIIVLLSLPVVGIIPYVAFVESQALGILGGGAWAKFFGDDLLGSPQYSLYGILLSLRQWGGHGLISAAAPYAVMLYAGFVLMVMRTSAKRAGSLLAGLALVNLASMAGYYVPAEYSAVGVTALVLLAAGPRDHRLSRVPVALLLWACFSAAAWPALFPVLWSHPSALEVIHVLGFVGAILVNVIIATRPPSVGAAPRIESSAAVSPGGDL